MVRKLYVSCALRLASFKMGTTFFFAVAILPLLLCGTAAARFDPTGWAWFNTVELPKSTPDGPAGIPLDSGIIEKSRSDLRDIRLVTETGALVPFGITSAKGDKSGDPVPANVYRIYTKPGKWTDVWVDKSVKSLSRGILIRTPSKGFVRKVEIRGSDSPTESFVIRMDGLIVDTRTPLPIHCTAIFYPVNNFRYLHIRILDGDSPPLKVAGISVYPPASNSPLSRPLAIRILENHRDPSGKTTTVVGDLGESRFPLCELVVDSRLKKFARRLTLFMSSSAADRSWEKVYEGVIFRLRKGEALAENLRIHMSPQPHRYFKLEARGGEADPFIVDSVKAVARARLLIFNHRAGRGYRIYYGNPEAGAPVLTGAPPQVDLARVAESAWKAVISPPHKPVVSLKSPPPATTTPLKEPSPSLLRKVIGVCMLLVGLLLLFVLMLRSRSTRRRNASRLPRIINTKH